LRRLRFFLHDKVSVERLERIDYGSQEDDVRVEHEVARFALVEERLELDEAPSESSLRGRPKLHIERLLDFGGIESPIDSILQEENRNVRIPAPDARDTNARESQIPAMRGNVDTVDL
jgi:hypothetical protein